jgi:hypothetical protein
MKKTPRDKARHNGFADGLHAYQCNTRQYSDSWWQTTEYLAGYMEGVDQRHKGVKFPDEE